MTFAVIETGGKQYKVSPGDTLKVEKLFCENKEGDKVTFDKVLLVSDEKETKIGEPYVEGAKVEATLQEQGRRKKIFVIKFRSKSRYFKKNGHRQPFTEVKIEAIK